MKHTTKIWLVIAAALVLIGTLGVVGVVAVNHWDFAVLSTERYETNTFDINEGFENISILSGTEDIAFFPSDDRKCRVVFYEQEKVKHTASVQNGNLLIETIDSRKWYDHIHITFSFDSPKISIYLPDSKYASLFVEESTGKIVIPKDFVFESIDLSLSTGNVDCSASCQGLSRIKTSTGNIHIENASAGELNLSVSTGKVDVRSVVCKGNVDVTVSTGKATLTDVSCKSFISSGSTGDITLENVIATEGISIERSTGDVKFAQCDAAELFVKTNTGDVTGTLLSEKVFITQSNTGRIEVPETTTGGKCKITTDTGNIVINIK